MLKKSYCAVLLTSLLISTSTMAGAVNVEPNQDGDVERGNSTCLANNHSVADIDLKSVLTPTTLNLRPQVGVRRPMG
jgi:hypothetical protein